MNKASFPPDHFPSACYGPGSHSDASAFVEHASGPSQLEKEYKASSGSKLHTIAKTNLHC